MNERKEWPEVWMSLAESISQRSCDEKLKVGAIIVAADNTCVLAVGYNGPAAGLPNERESMDPGCSGFIHAEANCLIKCDYHFHKEKHMYLTHSPCADCCKLLINGRIKKVVYKTKFRDTTGLLLLEKMGIEVVQFA